MPRRARAAAPVLAPVAVLLLLGPLAEEARACRIRETGRRHAAADWPGYLVDSAEVIVRAVAVGGDSGVVAFEAREWLRGPRHRPDTLRVGGRVVARDDYNRGPVPYAFVRPSGGRGGCYAREYRPGAEYLLLLRRGGAALTPYWSALAPVNELVRGAGDPWVGWVRGRVARSGGGPGGA
jgi:hypothetical protein